jgi:hypothetical protein
MAASASRTQPEVAMTAPFSNATETPTESGQRCLITCSIDQLRPHPSLVRLHIVPSAHDLSAAITNRSNANREPLTITQDGLILAGHAEWEIARREGEQCLPCLQLCMTEEEALLWLIQKHQRSRSMNDFNRILLALELEPWFKARARSNQQRGGQMKGSSNLTEADKLDVRSEIAAAASVSVGNVSKTKHLTAIAHANLLEALREGEVSIHRASTWIQNPEKQLDELRFYQNRRGIKRTITSLQRQHQRPQLASERRFDIPRMTSALVAMGPERMASVLIAEIQLPGQALFITSELLKALESQGELRL